MRTLLALTLIATACNHTASPSTTPAASSPAPPAASPASAPAAHPPAAAPAATTMTPPPAPDTLQTSAGPLVIHPIYHATLFFDWRGKEIVLDPWSKAGTRLAAVPKADYLFITHIHPDHLDPAAIRKLSKSGTTIVAPASVAAKLEPAHIAVAVVLHNGDTKRFATFSVRAVPMYNLERGPAPGKLYHPKGLGNGYVFSFGGKRVYVAGDTACTPEMKAQRHIDVAFVPMNLPYTMTPSEAATCVAAFKPKIVYPFHYRGQNPREFAKALAGTPGIEVRLRDWYGTGR